MVEKFSYHIGTSQKHIKQYPKPIPKLEEGGFSSVL